MQQKSPRCLGAPPTARAYGKVKGWPLATKQITTSEAVSVNRENHHFEHSNSAHAYLLVVECVQ